MNANSASCSTIPRPESCLPRCMSEPCVWPPLWDGTFTTKMSKFPSSPRGWSQPKTSSLSCATWRWSSHRRQPPCSAACGPAKITTSSLPPAPPPTCPPVWPLDPTSSPWPRLETCSRLRKTQASYQGIALAMPQAAKLMAALAAEGSPLLDLLHRHQRAVVAARGLDRARHHPGKSFAKFGKLRHQRLDHCRIVLKCERSIRHIAGLVLHDHVKIVTHSQRKDFRPSPMMDLVSGAQFHRIAVHGSIGGLRCLGLVIEFVGGERAHEVHGCRQGDRLAVIQPGIAILRLAPEIAGALREPCGIMSSCLRRSGVKTCQFPVAEDLLQHESQRPCSLAPGHVENGYAILSRRQIG